MVELIPEELLLNKGDILFRIKGDIGPASIVDEELEGLIFHDHLVRIRVTSKAATPDYLSIILNSNLVKNQTKRYEMSSSIRYIAVQDLKKILIPVIDLDMQLKIFEEIRKYKK